jgi:hypothetical protein
MGGALYAKRIEGANTLTTRPDRVLAWDGVTNTHTEYDSFQHYLILVFNQYLFDQNLDLKK